MKKWKKWTLGILSFIVVVIGVLFLIFWPHISMTMGADELSGDLEATPEVTAGSFEPVTRGEADWNSWNGPDGEKRSGVKNIITDWSNGLNLLWEVNYLCQGRASATWSAPVIQGNRLIAFGRNTDQDLVFCLNPDTGELIWQTAYDAPATPSYGTGPRATPFIDDDRVYTYGRSGDIACWNLYDGEEIWRKNVKNEGGEEPTWGLSSSPIILNDHVLVQGGGTAQIIAYDKMTGDMVWKSGEGFAGYAPVASASQAEKHILFAFHGKGFAALDAENGNPLWNVPWETEYDVNATTPIKVGDDRFFITSGYGTGCMLLEYAPDNYNIVWQNRSFASIHSDPYVIDGYLYGYSGDSFQNMGSFKCIDLGDGSEKWSTNKMGWGTCIFVDDHLICQNLKGNLFLMKPDPDKFILISKLSKALGSIKGPVWTMPVVANGKLYLRFKQALRCYDLVNR